MSKQIHGNDALRFWSYVSKSPLHGCWLWTGHSLPNGYGVIGIGGRKGKQVYVHRWIYQQLRGEIPKGLYICHSCDTKLCVNPKHLFLGTPKDNTQDGIQKGRIKKVKASKLKPSQVLAIRRSTQLGRILKAQYGISEALVSMIRNKKVWAHL